MALQLRRNFPLRITVVALVSAMFSVSAHAELWEELTREKGTVTARQSVPEGWLVKTSYGEQFQVIFLNDPQHTWKPLRSSPLVPTPGRYIELHEPTGETIQINIIDIVALKDDPNPASGFTTKLTLRYNGEITVRERQREIVNKLE
jgi:hypothetical protein